jgi:hypothetical protein
MAKRREHQDNSYIHRQPFPEPVSEEQQIDTENDGYHHHDNSYVHRQPFREPVSEEQEIDAEDDGYHQQDVSRNFRFGHLQSAGFYACHGALA